MSCYINFYTATCAVSRSEKVDGEGERERERENERVRERERIRFVRLYVFNTTDLYSPHRVFLSLI